MFLSGLVCALLATREAASAASLDQLGADHLASLDDDYVFAQESPVQKPAKVAVDPAYVKTDIDGGPGTYPGSKPAKKKEKAPDTEEDGDDCSKLAKAAGECVGGKRGGKDAGDAQKDKDKKDKDDKTTRD